MFDDFCKYQHLPSGETQKIAFCDRKPLRCNTSSSGLQMLQQWRCVYVCLCVYVLRFWLTYSIYTVNCKVWLWFIQMLFTSKPFEQPKLWMSCRHHSAVHKIKSWLGTSYSPNYNFAIITPEIHNVTKHVPRWKLTYPQKSDGWKITIFLINIVPFQWTFRNLPGWTFLQHFQTRQNRNTSKQVYDFLGRRKP